MVNIFKQSSDGKWNEISLSSIRIYRLLFRKMLCLGKLQRHERSQIPVIRSTHQTGTTETVASLLRRPDQGHDQQYEGLFGGASSLTMFTRRQRLQNAHVPSHHSLRVRFAVRIAPTLRPCRGLDIREAGRWRRRRSESGGRGRAGRCGDSPP